MQIAIVMASRRGPVHVVRNVRKHKDKEYVSYLLRRSVREGKKVLKETIANLSHLPEELIDIIRRFLAGETFVGARDAFETQRSLPHGHVAAVLGTLRGLLLDKMLELVGDDAQVEQPAKFEGRNMTMILAPK